MSFTDEELNDLEVVINLESPDAVYGITEAYIFNDMVEYSSSYSGYQFSVDAQCDGGNSSIFIPENYLLKAGGYYLTFTVPPKQDFKLSVSVKHVIFDYLNEESGTWKNDGCKAERSTEMPFCFLEDNIDHYGSDLYSLQKDSYEDCCAACHENSECKAWTYAKSGSLSDMCFLKYCVAPPSPNSYVISGTLQDTEEPPVVICPPDIEANMYIDIPTIQLTWSLPSVPNDSGCVSLSVSHERGSNFSIGVTTVSYKAEDLNGKAAYCWFNVTVKAIARPLFGDSNGHRENISTSEIIEKFDELSYTISQLENVNMSAEESKTLAQDILESMHEGIAVYVKSTAENEINDQDKELLTKSVLNTTDNLAKFVLFSIEPGSGPVELKTPSIGLNLETDSVEKLTNTSVWMGDGHGFRLPWAEQLFSNWTVERPINRIVS
ncbi:uncharacterized protein [Ptychodera flava]|uniref:uncharacterized protein n=1 Tax=Ptychodera flava TaxID=63121 RepID=UPI00396AA909